MAIARAITKEVLLSEKLHAHQRVTEYYIFLKGKAKMIVDNNSIVVEGGDVLVIEPGEFHKLTNILEEVDYITIRDSVGVDKIIKEEN